jgi:hypothetical protein
VTLKTIFSFQFHVALAIDGFIKATSYVADKVADKVNDSKYSDALIRREEAQLHVAFSIWIGHVLTNNLLFKQIRIRFVH